MILPFVARMALLHGAKVTLLHVLEPPRVLLRPVGSMLILPPTAVDALENEGLELLEAMREKLREMGVQAGVLLAHGRIADTIAKTARDMGADLVAMVSSHRPWLSRVLSDSVSVATYHRMDRGCLLLVRTGAPP
jgi:nucleotide-binding universal stress UspA family protein